MDAVVGKAKALYNREFGNERSRQANLVGHLS